jgi:uncharacterized protein involved in exopolysaccharide biosynthesis
MTYSEPERLALELQQLIERRARLRAILHSALKEALTEQEQADLRRVLDMVETEKDVLERRLQDLRSRRP